jgi:transposase
VVAMAEPEAEREFRMGWSLWRRAHQAVAKRCHSARRSLQQVGTPSAGLQHSTMRVIDAISEPMLTPLTDSEWERLRPLMPPQKPPTGRPRSDHRMVLAGILWVIGSDSSWRELPQEEFGPWRTIYSRYRKWRKEGLWQQIAEVLYLSATLVTMLLLAHNRGISVAVGLRSS